MSRKGFDEGLVTVELPAQSAEVVKGAVVDNIDYWEDYFSEPRTIKAFKVAFTSTPTPQLRIGFRLR